jgi:hypothetical protein
MTDTGFSNICRRVCAQEGWKLLTSGVEVRFEDGRHQLVELEYMQNGADEMVRLYTTIGAVASLTPVRLTIALRINAELAHGAFAVKDDDLVMVDTLMIHTASDEHVTASIRFLAETADYYEKAIFETDEN